MGIVHEAKHGDKIAAFSKDLGKLDAAYVADYGQNAIGQPQGSTVYYAVDLDAGSSEIQKNILPYFQGVAAGLGATPRYEIGVYGSGAVCKAVLDAGLAKRAWLAQSKGWTGYQAFLNSKRWSMRQLMPDTIAGVACDPNVPNSEKPDIGDFGAGAARQGTLHSVIARDGLRLRSGPGTEFDVLKLMPFGSRVFVLKNAGDWAQVDLQGDGASDGFANNHFLAPA